MPKKGDFNRRGVTPPVYDPPATAARGAEVDLVGAVLRGDVAVLFQVVAGSGLQGGRQVGEVVGRDFGARMISRTNPAAKTQASAIGVERSCAEGEDIVLSL